MPIAPEHQWFYPTDWRELSRLVRLARARGRRVRGLPGPGLHEAAQPDLTGIEPGPSLPVTRVALATAQLDHGPGHNRLRNLAAPCQPCRILHDAAEHRRAPWREAFRRRASGDPLGLGIGVGGGVS